jgi:hypothetical protein
MRSLEFLDPEIAQKLLEGHEDVVTSANEERDKFYAAQTCPRCGGNCQKLGDYRSMYSGEGALPKFYLRCLACGEEFDPHSGIILKVGNVGKAFVPAYPIVGQEED